MASESVKSGYERFLNKQVKLIYYDSPEHATTKEGILISISDDALVMFENITQKEILIPKARIVRIEERKNDK
ncbi:MAG: hypothetical protein K6T54_07000 [Ignavibacterium sp.]|nr:hypothetical protein [Ignavibacterium sp.]